MSDNFKDQIELLKDLVKVQEERDAAYETRDEDRERWSKAKNAYAEKRSYWRGIRELAGGEASADTVELDTHDAHGKVKEVK
jgi:hypothetical protein